MDAKRRDPIVHELKLSGEYFGEVLSGRKTAELRKMDRDYQLGDMMILQEYVNGNYTGRVIEALITHIYVGEYVAPGYGMLSFQLVFPCNEPRMAASTFYNIYSLYLEAQRELKKLKEELAS